MASKKSFAESRKNWLEQLVGDDRNSVKQQLLRMTWDLAVFRIVQEGIISGPKDDEGRPKVNGPVLDLLAGNFYKNFMVFIRRMTDMTKGSISLCRILCDMSTNASLFRRSAMLEAENLPYDYKSIQRKEQE